MKYLTNCWNQFHILNSSVFVSVCVENTMLMLKNLCERKFTGNKFRKSRAWANLDFGFKDLDSFQLLVTYVILKIKRPQFCFSQFIFLIRFVCVSLINKNSRLKTFFPRTSFVEYAVLLNLTPRLVNKKRYTQANLW